MSSKTNRATVIAAAAAGYKGQARQVIEQFAGAAYDQETSRCVQVVRMCGEAGLPERAAEMITSGRTVDEVAALLRRAATGARWDRTISSTGLAN